MGLGFGVWGLEFGDRGWKAPSRFASLNALMNSPARRPCDKPKGFTVVKRELVEVWRDKGFEFVCDMRVIYNTNVRGKGGGFATSSPERNAISCCMLSSYLHDDCYEFDEFV